MRALRTFLQSDPRSRAHRALLARVFGRTHAQVPVDRAIDQLVASEEPVIGFKECPVSQPDPTAPQIRHVMPTTATWLIACDMDAGLIVWSQVTSVVMADAESVRS